MPSRHFFLWQTPGLTRSTGGCVRIGLREGPRGLKLTKTQPSKATARANTADLTAANWRFYSSTCGLCWLDFPCCREDGQHILRRWAQ